jgi:hypothetical protein
LGQVIIDDPEGRVMALPSGFLYIVDRERGCHPDRSKKKKPRQFRSDKALGKDKGAIL